MYAGVSVTYTVFVVVKTSTLFSKYKDYFPHKSNATDYSAMRDNFFEAPLLVRRGRFYELDKNVRVLAIEVAKQNLYGYSPSWLPPRKRHEASRLHLTSAKENTFVIT